MADKEIKEESVKESPKPKAKPKVTPKVEAKSFGPGVIGPKTETMKTMREQQKTSPAKLTTRMSTLADRNRV